jgi:hypothetical protein
MTKEEFITWLVLVGYKRDPWKKSREVWVNEKYTIRWVIGKQTTIKEVRYPNHSICEGNWMQPKKLNYSKIMVCPESGRIINKTNNI